MLKLKLQTLFLFLSTLAIAQTDTGSWLVYKNKLQINEKTSIDTQYQHRSFELDLKEDQALITAGFTHAVSPNISIAAGYRKIAALDENGAYQKISFSTALNKVKLTNSFFLEERWLGDNFQLRYRFGLAAKMPLNSKTTFSVSEEVFLQNSGTSFNQNRVTAQFSRKFSPTFQFNAGLMHWQFPNTKQWVLLMSLTHTISL